MGTVFSRGIEIDKGATGVGGTVDHMAPPIAKVIRDLERYRYLLTATTDPGALAALKALIDETEAELRRQRSG